MKKVPFRVGLVLKGGPIVPSVTLYHKDGRVNARATAEHVQKLALNGAAGAVIAGTTGEGHLLNSGDKVALFSAVGNLKRAGLISPDFVLLAGTGTSDVENAKYLVRQARSQGFHGVLALPPKSPRLRRGFFKALAEECGSGVPRTRLALMLYHHPRLDPGYSVSPKLLVELMARHSVVVGVKDSSGILQSLTKWQAAARRAGTQDPLVAVGEDFHVLYGLQHGARCAIAGSANTRVGLSHLLTVFQMHEKMDDEHAESAQERLSRVTRFLLGKEKTGEAFRERARRHRIGQAV